MVFGRVATPTQPEKEAAGVNILVYKYLTHVPELRFTFVLVAVHTGKMFVVAIKKHLTSSLKRGMLAMGSQANLLSADVGYWQRG